jgi:hypothetical protein
VVASEEVLEASGSTTVWLKVTTLSGDIEEVLFQRTLRVPNMAIVTKEKSRRASIRASELARQSLANHQTRM